MNKKKKKNNNRREQSTYDPKLHHRSKGSSGYGLKRGTETDSSGAQLADILK